MNAALVPAAGASRRMGAPKLRLPFGAGETVLGSYLKILHEAGVERTVVAVAPGDDELTRLARQGGAEVAINPEPSRGMLSSLWAALDALGGEAVDALVVGPADFPALRAATVRRLLAAIAEGARLAVPVVEGARGHPLTVRGDLRDEIRGLDPAVGLRQLLDGHAPEIVEVRVDDRGAVLDVDDEESYRRALALAAGRDA